MLEKKPTVWNILRQEAARGRQGRGAKSKAKKSQKLGGSKTSPFIIKFYITFNAGGAPDDQEPFRGGPGRGLRLTC